MSGAINYNLMKRVKGVVDADVRDEIVNLKDFNEVHLTELYNIVLNMDEGEIVCVVSAAAKAKPYIVGRTIAKILERGMQE